MIRVFKTVIEASSGCRHFSDYANRRKSHPAISDFGPVIHNDYSRIRDEYQKPKHPVVLAHGLLGFDELHLAGPSLPGFRYWRGIREALTAKGINVIIASVPSSASIEQRAVKLARDIEEKGKGQSVNVIAHSMGGLDARYMISQLKPPHVDVLSLTTVASPHRGSSFADYVFDYIGVQRLPLVYRALEKIHMDTGAFSQLTRKYMMKEFNPQTLDREGVRYYSYGASVSPSLWSSFRRSHAIIEEQEGANDGLVSVASSQWGEYKGTLMEVSHLDLINWTNRLRWLVWEMLGKERKFNAIAFYLDICNMLAKEGL